MTMLKMIRITLLLALCYLASSPVLAQTQKFSSYVLGLTPVVTLTGTERIFALQAGVPVTTTPQQIISSIISLPALTLNGTITGNNQTINNININAGTITASSSIIANQYSSNITAIASITAGGTTKTQIAGAATIALASNDAINQFQSAFSLVGDATAGNRHLSIIAIEQGLAFRNINLAEGGGAVGINCTNGLVTTGALLEICTTGGGLKVDSTVASTSITTGAVIVAGGVGISGSLYTGGGILSIAGTVTPQIVFTPSSGATKTGNIYQSADSLVIASAGVSNWAVLNLATGQLGMTGPTGGLGYGVGAGGAVTQLTSRTTGVTLNNVTGAITLFSAAGSATPASFTVTNSAVAATDIVKVVQKSGTDLYEIFVTNVGASSFKITFFTTGGTTTEQPVFNFAVIKGSVT